jgi:hypothetical protein
VARSVGQLRGVEVVGVHLVPADALLTGAGRVRTVVTGRLAASLDERVQVTAGVVEARVGELDIRAIVVGPWAPLIHEGTRPDTTALSRENVCS